MTLKKIIIFLKKRFILVLILSAVILGVALLKLPTWQPVIFTSMILAYLLWALLHHFVEKSLTLEIALEYILTALFITIFLLGLML